MEAIIQLRDDYKRKLKSIKQLIDIQRRDGNGSVASYKVQIRLNTKFEAYRSFVAELERIAPSKQKTNRHQMIGFIGVTARHNGGSITSEEMELESSPCILNQGQTVQLVEKICKDHVEVSTYIADQLEATDNVKWKELDDAIIEEIYDNILIFLSQEQEKELKK